MKITDVKRLVKNIVKANKFHEPILMVGSKGIGKTEIIEQVSRELSEELKEDFGFVDLRLSTKEPAEISGFPYRTTIKLPNGDKREAMKYALPYWFPTEGTRGIIFLDEINRSHVDVRHGIMQLIRERRLEDFKVPDGWHIVAAMNPPDTGEYQVEELDPALQRRFCVLKASADLESWLEWAKGHGVDDRTTSFLLANDNLFTKQEKFSVKQDFSPDQWTRVNDSVFAVNEDGSKIIPEDLLAEYVSGIVGIEAAIPYIKWIEDGFERPVAGIDVLDNYDQIKDKLAKQANDQDFITLSQLIAEVRANDKPTKTRLDNLVKFIKESKAEMRSVFINRIPPNYSFKLMTRTEVTKALADVTREIRQ